MSQNKKETSAGFKIKSVNPRYINLKENIYEALSNDGMAVYLALRFEGDYSRDSSDIKKNRQFLANKAKISVRQVVNCLDELEAHGLILREANPGYQSTYWVAQDLNYFNKDIHRPVQEVHDPVQEVHDPVQEVHDINNNSFTNSSKDCIPARETPLITQLLTVNPFDLPKSLIEDWLTVRKDNKKPVTPTAWTRLMGALYKCREAGYDPEECFSIMVENAWASLKLEWIANHKRERKQNTPKQTQSRTEQQNDTSWMTQERFNSLEHAATKKRKGLSNV